MQLIIVESPTKARTLTRFLKGTYAVEASIGHVRDLPKSELGVDIEHDFTPRYIVPKAKQKHVGELRAAAAKAEMVILATDPDREGEAIAYHIAELLKEKDPKVKFVRIAFHEITQTAIEEALAHPRTIDLPLVDAQQARRILDRLVGYKLSPLLWEKLSKRWLSAGRVQSVAVRIIVEREREIATFAKKEYWTIQGVFSQPGVTANLISKNSVPYEEKLSFELFDGTYSTTSTTIHTEAEAKKIIADFAVPYTVTAVDKKEVKRHPAPPHTTSTLQQEAGRKLYFSAKKTMQIAQKLYEEGLITYHRTDSVNLSEKFITEARAYIAKEYGKEFIPAEGHRYQTKSKVAQEAHEAIRPTNVSVPTVSGDELNHDHVRLYELIWKRAMASQAKEAIFDSTTITITSGNAYAFEMQGSVVKFEGFLKITGRLSAQAGDIEEQFIPQLTVGQVLKLVESLPTQHFTNPPPRYTEASLVKTLEEKGIGRPSTYAPIISTIQERQYVTREDKKLLPTELGNTVTDFLVKYFPHIIDLPFTASLEDDLDAIANGEKQWVPVIRAFYEPFAKDLEKTYETATKVETPVEKLDEKCPLCGNPLVVKIGRFGKFIACSTFPTCKYTRSFVDKVEGLKCPRDGGDIVVKKTHRGKIFYGCSNYPNCTFAAWKKEDIK